MKTYYYISISLNKSVIGHIKPLLNHQLSPKVALFELFLLGTSDLTKWQVINNNDAYYPALWTERPDDWLSFFVQNGFIHREIESVELDENLVNLVLLNYAMRKLNV